MRTEGELPYWHLEHEVLLAEAEANVGDGAMEEAGGSQHQNQVKVPRKGRLERGTADLFLDTYQACVQLQKRAQLLKLHPELFRTENRNDLLNIFSISIIKKLRHRSAFLLLYFC